MPSTRLKCGPHAQVFSASTAPANATMAITFINPKTTRRAISAQQHARQNAPW
jgi:hypothetical protein